MKEFLYLCGRKNGDYVYLIKNHSFCRQLTTAFSLNFYNARFSTYSPYRGRYESIFRKTINITFNYFYALKSIKCQCDIIIAFVLM